ncbi:hypothetical protein [Mycobacterium avium]|uniref:Uncharacterized protein n=1 Tax=Mycobacterium avium subsp. hominissuis TaxID=439334 RepID=A0AAI8SSW8_MYCAV|nr:hypothetical protein [Mycobacterium avium]PBA08568.1 hypothetical protein CKJ70_25755 [Mycobacterium avium]BBN50769.1 hypothetical protein JPH1_52440 [Mycobacterium avium subsp. hominissuis]
MATTPAPAPLDGDADDVCRDPYNEGCTASLDDGEGWDGACGNCADRQYAEEHGLWWYADDAAANDQDAAGGRR